MTTFRSLVLCGGAGRRMQGRDKPLSLWAGETLVSHVLKTLPEGQVLISANRTLTEYESLGWPVIQDGTNTDCEGPLAGIAAAARTIEATDTRSWLYVVAGDTPKLPAELAAALHKCCLQTNSIAACVEAERVHPLPLLVRTDALHSVHSYLKSGNRSVMGWLKQLNATRLHRPADESLFVNINTPEQLEALNK